MSSDTSKTDMFRQKLIACIVGARPNFMKIAPILTEMATRPTLRPLLIHTGQHFSPEMSDSFFHDLEIPAPDVSLGINGGSSSQQIARIMLALEPIFVQHRPDLVLVVGDVNSTAAAAMVAAKLGIPVAHVEAGLRSFDRSMPEELNRLITDSLSSVFFTTEESGTCNLLREGISSHQIFFCGNVMIDTLLRFREAADGSTILKRLGIGPRGYVVATLHRPANVDDPEHLSTLIQMFQQVPLPVVFPVHPRTRNQMGLAASRAGNLLLTDPLGYLDFVKLMAESRLVLTDSGGIQEETTVLNVPCLTLRENTERPVTITHGTNRLVGTEPPLILNAIRESLSSDVQTTGLPALWDGHAARRILDVLELTHRIPRPPEPALTGPLIAAT